MEAENTGSEQQKRVFGRPFKKGQSGNPAGRPKGARNRLGEDFILALIRDFQKSVATGTAGVEAIERMREERPNEYAKMIASLLPKEIEGNINMGIGEALDALDEED